METTKILLTAGVLAVALGVSHRWGRMPPTGGIPADLRDAVADKSAISQLGYVDGGRAVSGPEPKAADKGYVAPVSPADPIVWVDIPGGKFLMGTTSIAPGLGDARPVHEVSLKPFQLSKTDVTAAQYAECVLKGVCTEPDTGEYCNWGRPDRKDYPVNCVDWEQAQTYAKFMGARLPSEAEFEYAATGGGKNQKYPWGNEEPTEKLAVFKSKATLPVCSRPMGNTAHGLCDMSGNVWQWVQDRYQNSYRGAPVDGGAFEDSGSLRVMRGGSFGTDAAQVLRADYRRGCDPSYRLAMLGFRLAR